MPIFYLEPKGGDTSHPRWATTNLREGCWVFAPDAATARLMVEQATIQMVDMVPGKPILHSPWQDAQLVDCWPDEPKITVPEDGIIVTVTGRTIS